MRKLLLAASLAAAAAALSGCSFGPSRKPVFVPIVERAADAAWPFVLPAQQPPAAPAEKEGKVILVAARLLAAPGPDLAKAGVDFDKPFAVLPGSASKAFDTLVRERRGQVLAAPRIVARPGQNATVTIAREYNYIGGYKPGKPDAPAPGPAALCTVHNGFTLAVRAELDGEQVAFTEVAPRMASLFGTRQCKSRISADKGAASLDWEEPVFLASEGALPAGARPLLKQGECLAVPMKDCVRVVVSEVRKRLDQPVTVELSGAIKFLAKPDSRGYPLPGRIVLVLTARAAEAGDPPAAPEPAKN
ncbi:MAG TPA: hypothetical protein PLE19_04075 [Planctomycetota bacterium]|nr:hypothetical protein [Planctomycetota bacterium]HRR80472.1 hypothetical protein [Planctomycetota bacterium]HRT93801.1 hypothetical protein [Planctomycetota bacterium]